MTQYNTLKVKVSNSQLNKLKSGIKNGTEVTLIIYSNVAGEKLLLTNTQVKLLQLVYHLI